MSEYYFHLDHLTVGYDKKPLIKDICIGIEKGEIVTLIGPNGSGKSTILKSITRQLKLVGGNVEFDGKNLHELSFRELSTKMAVVLTERMKPELMTCHDIVATGRYPYTGRLGMLTREDEEKVEKAMRAVHAEELGGRDFNAISDGQRQRILLARALCQQPEVILLDEPTAFLDVSSRIETMVLLHRLAVEQEKAVLLSTHDLDLAIQMGDCLWLQEKGRPMACGTPEDLIMSGAFESFFGKEGIVFDPATGKLNTEAPTSPIGVEGDFLTSYWVGNALIRNGYRPSPVKEGQLNITCKSPHELVVAFPEGCKEELRTVAELVSLIGMRKSFYGHGNNVSRL